MMNSRMSLKSALLGLVMVGAMPTSITKAQETPIAQTIMSFVKDYKGAFVGAAAWYIIDTRLRTRPRDTFSMNDLKTDFKELLHSLSIIDSKMYRQLVFLFDKYIIGLPIKLDDATTRWPKDEENGKVLTVKSKKLTQKPFGVYGLFDAYVLMPSKKFMTETMAGVALLYIYLNTPSLVLNGQLGDAQKKLNINITY